MFYIEKDNKIILSDTDLSRLKQTLLFRPDLSLSDIKETDKEIVDGVFTDTPEYLEIKRKELLDTLTEESKKLNNRDNPSMYLTSSLGFRVNADPKSIDNVDSLISIGDEITQFMDYDNELHELSLDDLKVIKLEIQKNGCNLYHQKWDMKSGINACTTIEELNAINIKFTMHDFSKEEVVDE